MVPQSKNKNIILMALDLGFLFVGFFFCKTSKILRLPFFFFFLKRTDNFSIKNEKRAMLNDKNPQERRESKKTNGRQ